MEQVATCKRTWNFASVLRIVSKIPENFCPYLSIDQVWWLYELWLKIYNSEKNPVSCSNTHHDVTDWTNHGMAKNTKTWISLEWNITFLRNKKILNLHLKLRILWSYRFVAEVTFKHYTWPLSLTHLKNFFKRKIWLSLHQTDRNTNFPRALNY